MHKLEQKNNFLSHKETICEIASGKLEEGTHCFGFKFDLPKDMPSSVFFKGEHDKDKPMAKVKYVL